MTAEHVTILEPTDLRALRVACRKCRAAITVQLNETVSVPPKCPLCGVVWQDQQTFDAPQAAVSLANALKTWLQIDRETKPQFALGFEIIRTSNP